MQLLTMENVNKFEKDFSEGKFGDKEYGKAFSSIFGNIMESDVLSRGNTTVRKFFILAKYRELIRTERFLKKPLSFWAREEIEVKKFTGAK